jgi:hypothetical protein
MRSAAALTLREYLEASRAPRYSVLFAVPLLLAYEVLAWLLADRSGLRNGADVLVKWLFVSFGGQRGLLVFELALAAFGIWLVVRDMKLHRDPLRPRIFAAMLAEAAVLALVVGLVVGQLTSALIRSLSVPQIHELDLPTQLMLSLGAGIYEELLFRVIIVGALAAIGNKVLRWTPQVAGMVACVVGALLFSAFHYVGPFGDPLEVGSFTFRFLAGMVFSALYLLRGFGITAWTHALYDVYVTLG